MTCRADGVHKQIHTHTHNLSRSPFFPHSVTLSLLLSLSDFRPLPPTPSTHTRSLPVGGLQRGVRHGGDADDHCSHNHVVVAFEAR
jgi:hypothetical protein